MTLALCATLVPAFGVSAAEQAAVSTADIQRLQDEVYQASTDVSRLRTTDALQAGRLQDELDTLREEVIYLKVKLRKESAVSRAEYTQLRDQLTDLRARRAVRRGPRRREPARERHPPAPVEPVPIYDDRPRAGTTRPASRGIPVGQEIDVRIQTELTSDTAQVEDRFEATTVVDLYEGNRVLIPAGSVMRGLVTSVNRASRTDRKGSLTVAFNQVTVNGRSYPMRGTVTEAIESSGIKGEAAASARARPSARSSVASSAA